MLCSQHREATWQVIFSSISAHAVTSARVGSPITALAGFATNTFNFIFKPLVVMSYIALLKKGDIWPKTIKIVCVLSRQWVRKCFRVLKWSDMKWERGSEHCRRHQRTIKGQQNQFLYYMYNLGCSLIWIIIAFNFKSL